MSPEQTKEAAPKRVHPNRVPFSGVLARIDVVSEKSPHGAKGHRVMLSREAAEEALWSLAGMGVSFAAQWDEHDVKRRCGVIERGWLDDDKLRVEGYLYCRDFPEIRTQLERNPGKMGMSYEGVDAHIRDLNADVWVMSKLIFTGAAILLCDKAAYQETSFTIMAAADEFRGSISFIREFETTGEVELSL